MKNIIMKSAMAISLAMLFFYASCSLKGPLSDKQEGTKKTFKRVGIVIGIKPEIIEEYRKLHADSNAGVRDLLKKYHMHNSSIFLQQIEGQWYEFGYYEYDGDDYAGDMAKLAAEPRNIEWLKVCDPMQIPLPGSQGWTEMECIYFNE